MKNTKAVTTHNSSLQQTTKKYITQTANRSQKMTRTATEKDRTIIHNSTIDLTAETGTTTSTRETDHLQGMQDKHLETHPGIAIIEIQITDLDNIDQMKADQEIEDHTQETPNGATPNREATPTKNMTRTDRIKDTEAEIRMDMKSKFS